MFPRKLFNVRASEMAQICLIAVFAYKDTKKYPFQKIYLLAELVHFFNHAFAIHFYVQFRGFDQTTPRSAPVCGFKLAMAVCYVKRGELKRDIFSIFKTEECVPCNVPACTVCTTY